MFNQKSKKEKFILGLSLSFLIMSGLILGVKALTIDTAVLSTQQIIQRIIVANNNSLATDDIKADLNFDGIGTSYINKLGIGTKTPLSALQVSGSIRANEICNQAGTSCTAIADIGSGG
jgi:hypothetical protein